MVNKEKKKNYLLMAVIGYKHAFKKLMQLTRYKIKGIYLQIKYKAAEASYKREIRKATKKKASWKETILKYLLLAIIGIGIFGVLQIQLEKQRGYRAVGGEMFVLALPLTLTLRTSLQKGDNKNE